MVLNPKDSNFVHVGTDEELSTIRAKQKNTPKSVLKLYLFVALFTMITVISISLLIFLLK